MANTEDTKHKFVELRAKGNSFDKISKLIGVSKPTLIKWSREFEHEVQNLKHIEEEALLEKYKTGKVHQVELLSDQLKAIRTELSKRDYSDVKTTDLWKMAVETQNKMSELSQNISFSEQNSGIFTLGETESWVA